MLNLDSFHPLLKKSNKLIKARIWMYIVSSAHLVVIATWLLSIDFTKAEDPSLWLYNKTRWKMITSWFNLLTFLYFPTSIYCDWRELRGESRWKHVELLNKARDLCFTSLLLPTTAFGDILFWRVWNKDRELIAPPSVDAIVPFWTQHCMHTVSLVWILMDLVMVPRERPRNMTLGFSLLTVFLTAYMFVPSIQMHTVSLVWIPMNLFMVPREQPRNVTQGVITLLTVFLTAYINRYIVCVESCLNGEYVYPGLKNYTELKKIIPLIAYIYIENFFYYTGQFLIVDMVWGTREGVKKI